jgi:hypothetical protein
MTGWNESWAGVTDSYWSYRAGDDTEYTKADDLLSGPYFRPESGDQPPRGRPEPETSGVRTGRRAIFYSGRRPTAAGIREVLVRGAQTPLPLMNGTWNLK